MRSLLVTSVNRALEAVADRCCDTRFMRKLIKDATASAKRKASRHGTSEFVVKMFRTSMHSTLFPTVSLAIFDLGALAYQVRSFAGSDALVLYAAPSPWVRIISGHRH
jgi:hypothetical protein